MIFKELTALRPESGRHWLCLGALLREREDHAGASAALDRAVEAGRTALLRYTGRADARSDLGAALLQAGKTEEAISLFREAIRLEPDLVGRAGPCLAHSSSGAASSGRPESNRPCDRRIPRGDPVETQIRKRPQQPGDRTHVAGEASGVDCRIPRSAGEIRKRPQQPGDRTHVAGEALSIAAFREGFGSSPTLLALDITWPQPSEPTASSTRRRTSSGRPSDASRISLTRSPSWEESSAAKVTTRKRLPRSGARTRSHRSGRTGLIPRTR